MARSRTDELLEGWKMVAHSARRPGEAPRRQVSRNGLSAGTLVAVVAAIVVIIALSSRGSSPAPQPTLPAVGEPTASASAIPSVVPSAPPSSSVPDASTAPEPTPTAGTPTAADRAAARAAIDTYTAHLVHGEYAAAWAMLGAEDPMRTLTLAQYSTIEKEDFAGLKGEYTIKVSPPGVAPITDWTSAISAAPIDLAHAVLVEVDYTVLAGNNAGWELFIVNPTPTGLKIYDVR